MNIDQKDKPQDDNINQYETFIMIRHKTFKNQKRSSGIHNRSHEVEVNF